ncbi:MAG: HtaA domain-containing protein [Mycetocola sp.]
MGMSTDDGLLEWGIWRDFIRYIDGISDSSIDVADGASRDDLGRFRFPAVSGVGDDRIMRFRGKVTITAYAQVLQIMLRNPVLQMSPEGPGYLLAENPYRRGHRVPIAQLQAPVDSGGRKVAVATLTVDGAALLSEGRFKAGVEVDPVSWSPGADR